MKEKVKNENIVINKEKLKSFLTKTILTILILLIVIFLVKHFIKRNNEGKLFPVKNEAHLDSIISKTSSKSDGLEVGARLFSISNLSFFFERRYYKYDTPDYDNDVLIPMPNSSSTSSVSDSFSSVRNEESSDYSTTNVQVENIDEADVIKTDGNYVYSISNNRVLITEVLNEKEPKVVSKVEVSSSLNPMDILINGDKLIVISTNTSSKTYKTGIDVFDITYRNYPRKLKNIKLNSTYNTSRMIDDKVYVFTNNTLSQYNKTYDFREYTEDYKEKEIAFSKIKYVKTNPTKQLTTFISLDLNSIEEDANISSYLVDLNTAYISLNNIYLLNSQYKYGNNNNGLFETVSSIFKWKGLFGIEDIYDSSNSSSGKITKITKYSFSKDKSDIEYQNNTEVQGKIINQYSCDEKDGNLRIALNDNKGTRIKVLDENLNEIGDTGAVAKGEDNKSVRFVGDRAYFVTYKNVDPLFVIDLSNPKDPKIMGELKIPGFSNYLHPYDDNHIIGIGMATNEEITRDNFGRPISERITFNGMKMTIFDISDIRNPKEKDVVYFGDSRTNSPINTNPKALLYSKEKNLIAIPVTNMGSQKPIKFVNSASEQDENELIKSELTINEPVSKGYIVFDLTSEGFKYKGIVTHEEYNKNNYNYYSNTNSNLLRGLYINDSLLTVSNNLLKINKLDNLDFVSNVNLLTDELKKEEVGKTFLPSNIKKAE